MLMNGAASELSLSSDIISASLCRCHNRLSSNNLALPFLYLVIYQLVFHKVLIISYVSVIIYYLVHQTTMPLID